MPKPRFTGLSDSYIFEEAGGMRDQLEQTILNELQLKQYPLQATISTIRAGKGVVGALFGTKEQCVIVNVDEESQIAISNTTVGTYLYVEVYLMVQEKNTFLAGMSAMTDNVFKQQKRNAFYSSAKAITESAFKKLNLKQVNSGYKSNQREIISED
ncbi:MAG: hypothetical protein HFH62_08835 [Lachnospiraceae bacterium]|nr:hypothetical protein [Lachnospiraceae bacterium]